jgi:hypothetical protein
MKENNGEQFSTFVSSQRRHSGQKWLRNFLLHDPHMSLQMPESVSWGTVLGSSAKKVALLFVLLESSSGKN